MLHRGAKTPLFAASKTLHEYDEYRHILKYAIAYVYIYIYLLNDNNNSNNNNNNN